MALALALSALVFAPAAANALEPTTTTYLALGDSISFGYTQERFNNHFPTESPSFFEEGVANDVTKTYLSKASELTKSIRLVNDACPGETSNGLIGENVAFGGAPSTETYAEIEEKSVAEGGSNLFKFFGGYQGLGDYHPCKYTFQNHLPLHNGGYKVGPTEISQLEEALGTLTSGKPQNAVKLVTINIGSNDELAGITQCRDEVSAEINISPGFAEWPKSPEPGFKKFNRAETLLALAACVTVGAKNVTFPHIISNVSKIVGAIDATGYAGPIVLIGYYNPDAIVFPGSDPLQTGLNKAFETLVVPGLNTIPNASGGANVTYANPFPIFNKGKEGFLAEQYSICRYTEMCNPNVQVAGGVPPGKDGDIHPSRFGYITLAKLVNEAFIINPASLGGTR